MTGWACFTIYFQSGLNMNNKDRQLVLDTKMYKYQTFGKEPYCKFCWANSHTACIMESDYRSSGLNCVKAECRMLKLPFRLREIVEPPSDKYRMYGCGGKS